jgi:hypothetical protein
MKSIVGRIMTKLAQRHSVWTSYPTLRIYDEFWLFVMMQCELWWNLWRKWHRIILFGLHIGLHIQHCKSMMKSDSLLWMKCDLWQNLKISWEFRHGSKDIFAANYRENAITLRPEECGSDPAVVVHSLADRRRMPHRARERGVRAVVG